MSCPRSPVQPPPAIDEARANTQKVFQVAGEKATSRGLAIARTPFGLTVAAMDEGEMADAEAFSRLPEGRMKATQDAIADIERNRAKS